MRAFLYRNERHFLATKLYIYIYKFPGRYRPLSDYMFRLQLAAIKSTADIAEVRRTLDALHAAYLETDVTNGYIQPKQEVTTHGS